jgi:lipopolysaccharide/colanic/teichoic acid biosynthesis glycosyltransferase
MSTTIYSSIHQRTGPEEDALATTGRHLRDDRCYEWCKRTLDLTASIGLLIVLSPLLVLIGLGVKLSGSGPILFKQIRLGRAGRRFWCYKFRTMVRDAERVLATRADLHDRFKENYKLDDDPRVTPIGGFLRRTSLDELPQLWNVVRGEMSLVGPRPIVEPELSKYGDHAATLLSVKPGLGGFWQVNGRSDTSYPERVQMDIHYINKRSIIFDLNLIVLTALAVLVRRGAR